jgi:hypothetical protein
LYLLLLPACRLLHTEFKQVADPIINFLSQLVAFIPDIKCPAELSLICNIDEIIFDLLSQVGKTGS